MLKLIDPDRALELVLEHAPRGEVSTVAVSEALALVLAETVRADRDFPPFSRSMMDGYAVRTTDAGGSVRVIGEVQAGHRPSLRVEPGTCVSIMTGAPCPPGTEAVVMMEQVTVEDGTVILPEQISAGQHIVARGSECGRGEVVLSQGAMIRPLAVAILASVGREQVQVIRPPTMAIISTGDELVDGAAEPVGEGQIRNSNGPMLAAMARRIGLPEPLQLHARDTEQSLAAALDQASAVDIILLTGGVSVGRYDLVPRALQAFRATPIFHKVTQKPGKPLLLCRRDDQLIFGLPGNPLSSHFCFHRYVTSAVRRMMERGVSEPAPRGELASDMNVNSDRTLFLLARVEEHDGRWAVSPLVGMGSADIFAGHEGDAYVRLPPGQHALQRGEVVSFEWLGERR